MTIVEYEGKKYDTGYEFEWLQDEAYSIKCLCDEYSKKNITASERLELQEIAKQMFTFQLAQSYEMIDDLQKILEKRAELRECAHSLHKRFRDR